MTNWNYRIIRHHHPEGGYLALHEVYYDEGEPTGVTAEPIDFVARFNGEGEEWAYNELIASFERVLQSLKDYPEVLDYNAFFGLDEPLRRP